VAEFPLFGSGTAHHVVARASQELSACADSRLDGFSKLEVITNIDSNLGAAHLEYRIVTACVEYRLLAADQVSLAVSRDERSTVNHDSGVVELACFLLNQPKHDDRLEAFQMAKYAIKLGRLEVDRHIRDVLHADVVPLEKAFREADQFHSFPLSIGRMGVNQR
jgi:hypothetical protein